MIRAFPVVLIGILTGTVSLAADDRPSGGSEPKRTRPTASEKLADGLSLGRAADYLDRVASEWTRERNCGSCHTNYPYLIARPSLGEYKSPKEQEIRSFFEDRVAHWDDQAEGAKPRWDAEVVATAQALAMHDAETTRRLHPLTRKALNRMWKLQQPDGGWEWLKCGWPPFEHDDYYGAIVAALAAGYAPDGYALEEAPREGVEKLRGYFRQNPPPDLHHRTLLLWASARLPGLMDEGGKQGTIVELRSKQRPDGGWALPSLGSWKRRDGNPNDPAAPSDGYGTAIVVLVLRESGIPASDPAIERGVRWLKGHQLASGRWFTRSLNNDKAHYITDAGTSFAVMALRRCEGTTPTASPRADRSRETDRGRPLGSIR